MIRLLLALSLVLGVTVAGSARADPAWPSRPLRLIVPSNPGGSVDKISRVIGKRLQDRLGQPVVVENRAGAGGTIAAEVTASAAPDGYTLMMGTVSSLATNVSLEKLRYDPLTDFVPVILVARQELVLVIASSAKADTVAEVVGLARSNPGTFSFASAGRGTGGHLSGELFSQLSGVPMLHVPYRGVAQAANDVAGGLVTITFTSLASAHPLIESRKVRPIAVTGEKRAPAYPGLPTMEEAGIRGYESSTWYALVAPARTPADVVHRLNAEVDAILREEQVAAQLSAEGIELVGGSPQRLGEHMKSEIDKWGRVIRAAGLGQDK